ncbi:hypothetical protein E3N88_00306 [Mikania micrantha]|uniref:Uncharacterized protein n=1 Tax=Mikania micrantha TaxID=192012 RepID=A0A5N6Q0F1_9ASTR|nr:hypothetical protein E3N88_00306 [Mikania micrantha]
MTVTAQKQTENHMFDTEKHNRYLRGECFRCGEKYGPGRRCKTGTFKLLEVLGETDTPAAITDADHLDTQEDKADISFNALFGNSATKMMQLPGSIGSTGLRVLIDSGSTYNFISDLLVRNLNLPIQFVTPFGVKLGNGDIIRHNHKLQGITSGPRGHADFQHMVVQEKTLQSQSKAQLSLVYDTGQQALSLLPPFRLEDKSVLWEGSIDTNPVTCLVKLDPTRGPSQLKMEGGDSKIKEVGECSKNIGG